MPSLRPVVLSGGSGTRLWPLSTPEVPKQFAPLFAGRTLFAMTLQRLVGLAGLGSSVIVTGAEHSHLVARELAALSLDPGVILVEPMGRNTAPAALAAALVAEPGDVLLILPSDHLIQDEEGFRATVTTAADLASEDVIVTFGIVPTRAETGHGYIEMGDVVGPARTVSRFKEKPDADEAGVLATDGRHVWNSGMFLARADHLLAQARELCPRVVAGVEAALPESTGGLLELGPEFRSVDAISFDHAIMERTSRAVVLPLDVGWSDVGSYRSLLEVSDRDGLGNHVSGPVTATGMSGSYVRATSRRVVVAGLDEVVVVETPEAVLVVPLGMSQDVKELQARSTDS